MFIFKISKMIQTFVFFDLETTGLIVRDVMPKITEISLIAVSRKNIYETTDLLPRVLHKLVLPIKPHVYISERVKGMTGLSNENLEGIQCFNVDVYALIINFINRQKAPVCFVAYNGNKFDYPIFLSELERINKQFSEDILSIDMLLFVREYFLAQQNKVEEARATNIDTSNRSSVEANTLLNDGYDTFLSDALDSVMNGHFDWDDESSISIYEGKKNTSSLNNVVSTTESNWTKKMQQINEKTPESQIIKSERLESLQNRRDCARRKLDFTNSSPVNYKLVNVYKHLIGTEPENKHTAEGDCISMIRCAIKLGNCFAEWADSKAVPLIHHTKQ